MNKRSVITMVVFAIATLATASSVMAQNEVTKMLLGEWKGDAERTRKALQEVELDEAVIEAVMTQIPRITVTFAKDDVFKMKLDDPLVEEDFEGTWKPKSEDAEKMECVIVLAMEAAADESQELTCKFLDMGQFVHIIAGNEPPIVFKRVKE